MVVLLDADREAVERAAFLLGQGVAFPGPSLGLLDELEEEELFIKKMMLFNLIIKLLTFTTQFKSGLTCSDFCAEWEIVQFMN